ncbi:DUF4399 domain-containing protein [Marinobacterium rhizophilum]|uniref:DUF4399 domain-containing protein n=1 Tax=Marinobacterium rhizophilum TaxID=420402 RepID=A0ABY5HK13_9GAMM|nr:DUF4399 domain-containing protein [Marinobacterium rhizophilum]UTW11614.1 DUF4399 domain-containing protein [Marinobacterium rhizophilum]
MNFKLTLLCIALATPATPALADSAAPAGARAYIISPAHGETVPRTFRVRFGLSGMGVAPAGTDREGTGHHHLLIDRAELPPAGVPMDGTVQHFGGGQTEVDLTLEPGEHSLQLLLGDMLHVPHNPPVVSQKILIQVE